MLIVPKDQLSHLRTANKMVHYLIHINNLKNDFLYQEQKNVFVYKKKEYSQTFKM